jgi:DNA repair protein RadC
MRKTPKPLADPLDPIDPHDLQWKSAPIRTWALDDRPREKMASRGQQALSSSELLAILIGSGYRSGSALNIARAILEYCGNDPRNLGQLHLKDYMKFKGIGEARASILMAALELGRRIQWMELKAPHFPMLTNANEVLKQIPTLLRDREQEVVILICVNQQNQIVQHKEISRGGINACLVDIRMVLRIALEWSAKGIILVHNHPSGTDEPSQADIYTTIKLKEAAATMDIQLLDHLIYCKKSWFSFAHNGMMAD